MTQVYQHREPDRVPITDGPWESTLVRWRREGLPQDVRWDRYFDVDRIVAIGVDTSPRYEREVIEETDSYIIERDSWGITKRNFKPVSSTFEHLDHVVRDPGTWQAAKRRMRPTRERIDWPALEGNYATWREQGAWIKVAPWFGYDIVNARLCNTETVLYAMADNPAWVADMCNHLCDLALALLDVLWAEGYVFDELMWFDDMAYRNGMLFSKKMWREIVRPYQERAIHWAHAHGIAAHLHCCGDISALLPELVDLGLDALNPLEVKAGMDAARIKREYGDDLVLQGGFDIRLWEDGAKAEENIRALLPVMMESGGYVFASDHSIADSVSLENYGRIVSLVKEVGTYAAPG
jgi:uroporphyrinogen decarboxylase